MHQASLSFAISWSLLKLMSIESVMPSNHLIFCLPFLFPVSIFPSIRDFPNELALYIRWPKYWSFSFIISPSSKYSGLISSRIDWLSLQSLQSKGLSKVSSNTTVQKHQLFGVQPSLWSNSHNRTWPMGRLDCMDLCWQSSVLLCHSVPAKKQTSDSMAAVTIHSDVRGQKGEICHYCHLFHLYLPWS